MILFDTHAHFPEATAAGHEAQIERAREAGLVAVLAVGGDPSLETGAIAMARKFPGFVHLALGIDRDMAATAAASPAALDRSINALRDRIRALEGEGVGVYAIGETGLDFSRGPSQSEKDAQIALFEAQLGLADEMRLPCTIHSRDAEDATLASIARCASAGMSAAGRIGAIHCFTGGPQFAQAAIGMGLHIGISGIYTFLNADPLRATVGTLPRDRLLLETDCPYLTPAPMRGKPNEPAMLPHIARRLGDELGMAHDEAAAMCTANAKRLFAVE